MMQKLATCELKNKTKKNKAHALLFATQIPILPLDMISEDMMLSIATVGYLNVFGSYAGLSHKNAHLVAAMLQHVHENSTGTPYAWEDFQSHVLDQPELCDESGVLITWRPRRCIDVAILPASHDAEKTLLALPLHGTHTTVELFMPHESIVAGSS